MTMKMKEAGVGGRAGGGVTFLMNRSEGIIGDRNRLERILLLSICRSNDNSEFRGITRGGGAQYHEYSQRIITQNR